MATQQELMNQALAEMKKATLTPTAWCKFIDDKESYDYRTTHNFKAQQLMWEAAHANPNVHPPSDDYLNVVRNCLFLTDDISHALAAKNYLLIATADMGYRKNYTAEFIRTAIAQDRFRVWCDCRASPDGTPPQVALEWLYDLKLPPSYFYGQCENPNEFDAAYIAGARRMVGKIDSLTHEQLQLVANKEVLITNETYYNVQPDLVPNWRNANVGIGSNCSAVYGSVTEGARYYALRAQAAADKFIKGRDCVYVAGFHDDDWNYLLEV